MDETNVIEGVAVEAKKKKSKLDIAMDKYRRMKAMEKRAADSAEKERKAEEERKKRKEKRKAAEKAVAAAKKELAAVRAYADVKKEPSNLRKQYAVKGFFDLMDACNSEGTRDYTDAYNFIGDTKWLLDTLKKHLKVNIASNTLEIDIVSLRDDVFAKKAEIEEIINTFKTQLDEEWKKKLKEQKKKN